MGYGITISFSTIEVIDGISQVFACLLVSLRAESNFNLVADNVSKWERHEVNFVIFNIDNNLKDT